MRQTCGGASVRRRERGGSRLNFLIVLTIVVVVGYSGYQIVPVYYHASQFQTYMQDMVNQAAMTNKPPAWVEQQLRGQAEFYGVPPDALIAATVRSNRLEAHVAYTLPIPLLVTTYEYKFDQTVKSATTTG